MSSNNDSRSGSSMGRKGKSKSQTLSQENQHTDNVPNDLLSSLSTQITQSSSSSLNPSVSRLTAGTAPIKKSPSTNPTAKQPKTIIAQQHGILPPPTRSTTATATRSQQSRQLVQSSNFETRDDDIVSEEPMTTPATNDTPHNPTSSSTSTHRAQPGSTSLSGRQIKETTAALTTLQTSKQNTILSYFQKQDNKNENVHNTTITPTSNSYSISKGPSTLNLAAGNSTENPISFLGFDSQPTQITTNKSPAAFSNLTNNPHPNTTATTATNVTTASPSLHQINTARPIHSIVFANPALDSDPQPILPLPQIPKSRSITMRTTIPPSIPLNNSNPISRPGNHRHESSARNTSIDFDTNTQSSLQFDLDIFQAELGTQSPLLNEDSTSNKKSNGDINLFLSNVENSILNSGQHPLHLQRQTTQKTNNTIPNTTNTSRHAHNSTVDSSNSSLHSSASLSFDLDPVDTPDELHIDLDTTMEETGPNNPPSTKSATTANIPFRTTSLNQQPQHNTIPRPPQLNNPNSGTSVHSHNSNHSNTSSTGSNQVLGRFGKQLFPTSLPSNLSPLGNVPTPNLTINTTNTNTHNTNTHNTNTTNTTTSSTTIGTKSFLANNDDGSESDDGFSLKRMETSVMMGLSAPQKRHADQMRTHRAHGLNGGSDLDREAVQNEKKQLNIGLSTKESDSKTEFAHDRRGDIWGGMDILDQSFNSFENGLQKNLQKKSNLGSKQPLNLFIKNDATSNQRDTFDTFCGFDDIDGSDDNYDKMAMKNKKMQKLNPNIAQNQTKIDQNVDKLDNQVTNRSSYSLIDSFDIDDENEPSNQFVHLGNTSAGVLSNPPTQPNLTSLHHSKRASVFSKPDDILNESTISTHIPTTRINSSRLDMIDGEIPLSDHLDSIDTLGSLFDISTDPFNKKKNPNLGLEIKISPPILPLNRQGQTHDEGSTVARFLSKLFHHPLPSSSNKQVYSFGQDIRLPNSPNTTFSPIYTDLQTPANFHQFLPVTEGNIQSSSSSMSTNSFSKPTLASTVSFMQQDVFKWGLAQQRGDLTDPKTAGVSARIPNYLLTQPPHHLINTGLKPDLGSLQGLQQLIDLYSHRGYFDERVLNLSSVGSNLAYSIINSPGQSIVDRADFPAALVKALEQLGADILAAERTQKDKHMTNNMDQIDHNSINASKSPCYQLPTSVMILPAPYGTANGMLQRKSDRASGKPDPKFNFATHQSDPTLDTVTHFAVNSTTNQQIDLMWHDISMLFLSLYTQHSSNLIMSSSPLAFNPRIAPGNSSPSTSLSTSFLDHTPFTGISSTVVENTPLLTSSQFRTTTNDNPLSNHHPHRTMNTKGESSYGHFPNTFNQNAPASQILAEPQYGTKFKSYGSQSISQDAHPRTGLQNDQSGQNGGPNGQNTIQTTNQLKRRQHLFNLNNIVSQYNNPQLSVHFNIFHTHNQMVLEISTRMISFLMNFFNSVSKQGINSNCVHLLQSNRSATLSQLRNQRNPRIGWYGVRNEATTVDQKDIFININGQMTSRKRLFSEMPGPSTSTPIQMDLYNSDVEVYFTIFTTAKPLLFTMPEPSVSHNQGQMPETNLSPAPHPATAQELFARDCLPPISVFFANFDRLLTVPATISQYYLSPVVDLVKNNEQIPSFRLDFDTEMIQNCSILVQFWADLVRFAHFLHDFCSQNLSPLAELMKTLLQKHNEIEIILEKENQQSNEEDIAYSIGNFLATDPFSDSSSTTTDIESDSERLMRGVEPSRPMLAESFSKLASLFQTIQQLNFHKSPQHEQLLPLYTQIIAENHYLQLLQSIKLIYTTFQPFIGIERKQEDETAPDVTDGYGHQISTTPPQNHHNPQPFTQFYFTISTTHPSPQYNVGNQFDLSLIPQGHRFFIKSGQNMHYSAIHRTPHEDKTMVGDILYNTTSDKTHSDQTTTKSIIVLYNYAIKIYPYDRIVGSPLQSFPITLTPMLPQLTETLLDNDPIFDQFATKIPKFAPNHPLNIQFTTFLSWQHAVLGLSTCPDQKDPTATTVYSLSDRLNQAVGNFLAGKSGDQTHQYQVQGSPPQLSQFRPHTRLLLALYHSHRQLSLHPWPVYSDYEDRAIGQAYQQPTSSSPLTQSQQLSYSHLSQSFSLGTQNTPPNSGTILVPSQLNSSHSVQHHSGISPMSLPTPSPMFNTAGLLPKHQQPQYRPQEPNHNVFGESQAQQPNQSLMQNSNSNIPNLRMWTPDSILDLSQSRDHRLERTLLNTSESYDPMILSHIFPLMLYHQYWPESFVMSQLPVIQKFGPTFESFSLRYRAVGGDKLGSGNFGSVSLYYDPVNRERVVLKQIKCAGAIPDDTVPSLMDLGGKYKDANEAYHQHHPNPNLTSNHGNNNNSNNPSTTTGRPLPPASPQKGKKVPQNPPLKSPAKASGLNQSLASPGYGRHPPQRFVKKQPAPPAGKGVSTQHLATLRVLTREYYLPLFVHHMYNTKHHGRFCQHVGQVWEPSKINNTTNLTTLTNFQSTLTSHLISKSLSPSPLTKTSYLNANVTTIKLNMINWNEFVMLPKTHFFNSELGKYGMVYEYCPSGTAKSLLTFKTFDNAINAEHLEGVTGQSTLDKHLPQLLVESSKKMGKKSLFSINAHSSTQGLVLLLTRDIIVDGFNREVIGSGNDIGHNSGLFGTNRSAAHINNNFSNTFGSIVNATTHYQQTAVVPIPHNVLGIKQSNQFEQVNATPIAPQQLQLPQSEPATHPLDRFRSSLVPQRTPLTQYTDWYWSLDQNFKDQKHKSYQQPITVLPFFSRSQELDSIDDTSPTATNSQIQSSPEPVSKDIYHHNYPHPSTIPLAPSSFCTFTTLSILQQLSQGLSVMHESDTVHLDIKLDNILLKNSPQMEKLYPDGSNLTENLADKHFTLLDTLREPIISRQKQLISMLVKPGVCFDLENVLYKNITNLLQLSSSHHNSPNSTNQDDNTSHYLDQYKHHNIQYDSTKLEISLENPAARKTIPTRHHSFGSSQRQSRSLPSFSSSTSFFGYKSPRTGCKSPGTTTRPRRPSFSHRPGAEASFGSSSRKSQPFSPKTGTPPTSALSGVPGRLRGIREMVRQPGSESSNGKVQRLSLDSFSPSSQSFQNHSNSSTAQLQPMITRVVKNGITLTPKKRSGANRHGMARTPGSTTKSTPTHHQSQNGNKMVSFDSTNLTSLDSFNMDVFELPRPQTNRQQQHMNHTSTKMIDDDDNLDNGDDLAKISSHHTIVLGTGSSFVQHNGTLATPRHKRKVKNNNTPASKLPRNNNNSNVNTHFDDFDSIDKFRTTQTQSTQPGSNQSSNLSLHPTQAFDLSDFNTQSQTQTQSFSATRSQSDHIFCPDEIESNTQPLPQIDDYDPMNTTADTTVLGPSMTSSTTYTVPTQNNRHLMSQLSIEAHMSANLDTQPPVTLCSPPSKRQTTASLSSFGSKSSIFKSKPTPITPNTGFLKQQLMSATLSKNQSNNEQSILPSLRNAGDSSRLLSPGSMHKNIDGLGKNVVIGSPSSITNGLLSTNQSSKNSRLAFDKKSNNDQNLFDLRKYRPQGSTTGAVFSVEDEDGDEILLSPGLLEKSKNKTATNVSNLSSFDSDSPPRMSFAHKIRRPDTVRNHQTPTTAHTPLLTVSQPNKPSSAVSSSPTPPSHPSALAQSPTKRQIITTTSTTTSVSSGPQNTTTSATTATTTSLAKHGTMILPSIGFHNDTAPSSNHGSTTGQVKNDLARTTSNSVNKTVFPLFSVSNTIVPSPYAHHYKDGFTNTQFDVTPRRKDSTLGRTHNLKDTISQNINTDYLIRLYTQGGYTFDGQADNRSSPSNEISQPIGPGNETDQSSNLLAALISSIDLICTNRSSDNILGLIDTISGYGDVLGRESNILMDLFTSQTDIISDPDQIYFPLATPIAYKPTQPLPTNHTGPIAIDITRDSKSQSQQTQEILQKQQTCSQKYEFTPQTSDFSSIIDSQTTMSFKIGDFGHSSLYDRRNTTTSRIKMALNLSYYEIINTYNTAMVQLDTVGRGAMNYLEQLQIALGNSSNHLQTKLDLAADNCDVELNLVNQLNLMVFICRSFDQLVDHFEVDGNHYQTLVNANISKTSTLINSIAGLYSFDTHSPNTSSNDIERLLSPIERNTNRSESIPTSLFSISLPLSIFPNNMIDDATSMFNQFDVVHSHTFVSKHAILHDLYLHFLKPYQSHLKSKQKCLAERFYKSILQTLKRHKGRKQSPLNPMCILIPTLSIILGTISPQSLYKTTITFPITSILPIPKNLQTPFNHIESLYLTNRDNAEGDKIFLCPRLLENATLSSQKIQYYATLVNFSSNGLAPLRFPVGMNRDQHFLSKTPDNPLFRPFDYNAEAAKSFHDPQSSLTTDTTLSRYDCDYNPDLAYSSQMESEAWSLLRNELSSMRTSLASPILHQYHGSAKKLVGYQIDAKSSKAEHILANRIEQYKLLTPEPTLDQPKTIVNNIIPNNIIPNFSLFQTQHLRNYLSTNTQHHNIYSSINTIINSLDNQSDRTLLNYSNPQTIQRIFGSSMSLDLADVYALGLAALALYTHTDLPAQGKHYFALRNNNVYRWSYADLLEHQPQRLSNQDNALHSIIFPQANFAPFSTPNNPSQRFFGANRVPLATFSLPVVTLVDDFIHSSSNNSTTLGDIDTNEEKSDNGILFDDDVAKTNQSCLPSGFPNQHLNSHHFGACGSLQSDTGLLAQRPAASSYNHRGMMDVNNTTRPQTISTSTVKNQTLTTLANTYTVISSSFFDSWVQEFQQFQAEIKLYQESESTMSVPTPFLLTQQNSIPLLPIESKVLLSSLMTNTTHLSTIPNPSYLATMANIDAIPSTNPTLAHPQSFQNNSMSPSFSLAHPFFTESLSHYTSTSPLSRLHRHRGECAAPIHTAYLDTFESSTLRDAQCTCGSFTQTNNRPTLSFLKQLILTHHQLTTTPPPQKEPQIEAEYSVNANGCLTGGENTSSLLLMTDPLSSPNFPSPSPSTQSSLQYTLPVPTFPNIPSPFIFDALNPNPIDVVLEPIRVSHEAKLYRTDAQYIPTTVPIQHLLDLLNEDAGCPTAATSKPTSRPSSASGYATRNQPNNQNTNQTAFKSDITIPIPAPLLPVFPCLLASITRSLCNPAKVSPGFNTNHVNNSQSYTFQLGQSLTKSQPTQLYQHIYNQSILKKTLTAAKPSATALQPAVPSTSQLFTYIAQCFFGTESTFHSTSHQEQVKNDQKFATLLQSTQQTSSTHQPSSQTTDSSSNSQPLPSPQHLPQILSSTHPHLTPQPLSNIDLGLCSHVISQTINQFLTPYLHFIIKSMTHSSNLSQQGDVITTTPHSPSPNLLFSHLLVPTLSNLPNDHGSRSTITSPQPLQSPSVNESIGTKLLTTRYQEKISQTTFVETRPDALQIATSLNQSLPQVLQYVHNILQYVQYCISTGKLLLINIADVIHAQGDDNNNYMAHWSAQQQYLSNSTPISSSNRLLVPLPADPLHVPYTNILYSNGISRHFQLHHALKQSHPERQSPQPQSQPQPDQQSQICIIIQSTLRNTIDQFAPHECIPESDTTSTLPPHYLASSLLPNPTQPLSTVIIPGSTTHITTNSTGSTISNSSEDIELPSPLNFSQTRLEKFKFVQTISSSSKQDAIKHPLFPFSDNHSLQDMNLIDDDSLDNPLSLFDQLLSSAPNHLSSASRSVSSVAHDKPLVHSATMISLPQLSQQNTNNTNTSIASSSPTIKTIFSPLRVFPHIISTNHYNIEQNNSTTASTPTVSTETLSHLSTCPIFSNLPSLHTQHHGTTPGESLGKGSKLNNVFDIDPFGFALFHNILHYLAQSATQIQSQYNSILNQLLSLAHTDSDRDLVEEEEDARVQQVLQAISDVLESTHDNDQTFVWVAPHCQ